MIAPIFPLDCNGCHTWSPLLLLYGEPRDIGVVRHYYASNFPLFDIETVARKAVDFEAGCVILQMFFLKYKVFLQLCPLTEYLTVGIKVLSCIVLLWWLLKPYLSFRVYYYCRRLVGA